MFRRNKNLDGVIWPKRKVIMVSIYYYGNEPEISREKEINWDNDEWDIPNDYLFLNDSIEDVLENYNPTSEIFDVAIDDVKPMLHNKRISKWFYKLIRA